MNKPVLAAELAPHPALHTPVTIARGDGIGPEIMDSCLDILEAAGARLKIETIEIGESCYLAGHGAGIAPQAWESLRRTGVFYKAPITTPQGGGFKSLNVTVRKGLGLFANVRPCLSLHPFVATKHPKLDLVIIRENEEDLYAGIEHRQTDDVVQCLKIISRPGTEKIVRYAFEYARVHGRKKVSCFTKDNIMKLTDGLFHQVFVEIGSEYPTIEKEHWIVDIGAAKLADTPEAFDVLVLPNLYGDILSDVAAQIAGSVGLAGSANIGAHGAMFEAIHGSAPRRAGQDIANPSGLLMGGVMMLHHIGQGATAAKVHNAWLATIEDGIHTYDVFDPAVSKSKVGTKAFAKAVIERLGAEPTRLPKAVRQPGAAAIRMPPPKPRTRANKELLGVDVFVHWDGATSDLAGAVQKALTERFGLTMISNRGVKVWPEGLSETFLTDHWRCRLMAKSGRPLASHDIATLLARFAACGIDFIKTEHLYAFDGLPGFSLGQGQ